MIRTQYNQGCENIRLCPHGMQFIIDNLLLITVCLTCIGYAGIDDMPLTFPVLLVSVFLILVLGYRYIYLRRIRYRITDEQLVCERGILFRKIDYMELYRIVDFCENQSLLQQIFGLKTVSILSMDRNTPRLDLLGMRNSEEIVGLIRERVEFNKQKKGIYEITNH